MVRVDFIEVDEVVVDEVVFVVDVEILLVVIEYIELG